MLTVLSDLVVLIPLLIGIALLVIECFLPGFGVPGISGLVMEGVALYFTASRYGTAAALVLIAAVLFITGIVIFLSFRSASKGRLSKTKFILNETEQAQPELPFLPATGAEGTALTVLRPSGTALFGEQRLDVVTEGDYIRQGQSVRVVRVDGSKVVVRKV